jgi:hypothetical protein
MRVRYRILLLILLLGGLAVASFFLFRPAGQAAFGPAIAFCPGPDLFGYSCAGADGYAYVDATQDSGLRLDDGFVTLVLPFPFNFYGATYETVQAGSNGVLQFGRQSAGYWNECLDGGPVPGLGDAIMPYWDDLDLSMGGRLETEVVGVSPNRAFVIEWENAPPYGASRDDGVTFAVHLLEGSNDILFFYRDVTTQLGNNGRSATIGLQSEAAGISLQFSCGQPAISDGAKVRFVHPDAPNRDVARAVSPPQPILAAAPQAKGETAVLLDALNLSGANALPRLQRHWLNERPQRLAEWVWLDLDGNGRDELVMLWRGPAVNPELAQLAAFAQGADGQMALLLDQRLATGDGNAPQLRPAEVADLTGDGQMDLLLTDPDNGYQFVLTLASGALQLVELPGRCNGRYRLLSDQTPLVVVRERCEGEENGRLSLAWDGRTFAPLR